jgi:hypothetical protein
VVASVVVVGGAFLVVEEVAAVIAGATVVAVVEGANATDGGTKAAVSLPHPVNARAITGSRATNPKAQSQVARLLLLMPCAPSVVARFPPVIPA